MDTFKNWAVQESSVGTPVGTYIGECVSLIQQYLSRVFGIPFQARGHAKDWATNANVLSHFDKVNTPQAGDIGVSGATPSNPYAHIWIYLTPNLILEQNGRVPRRVSTGTPYLKPIAILRRKSAPAQGDTDMATNQQIDETISLLGQLIYGKALPDSVFKDWRNLIKNNPNNSLEGLLGILKGSDTNQDALKNQKPKEFEPYSGKQLFVKKG